MIPKLEKVVLNGASRHCLSKGFILVNDSGLSVNTNVCEQVIQNVNQIFEKQPNLSGFVAETRENHPSLIGLTTSFLSVYNVSHRNLFISHLEQAINILNQAARYSGCHLIPAGVNPLRTDNDKQIPALCADFHRIEVFDDGEIERIYNLFRQFLPELLAISTHAAVYGGILQKDFSLRMRINPASFLPRYLSQFSNEHLDRLRSMMRKDYGLANLKQMDINPLAGDSKKLMQENTPLFSAIPPAIELRFIDAQCAYPFIRAQLILFQAIAMYGRTLSRAGKRLPYMRDEVIDENKALAIQSGPGAILKPDDKFKKDDGRRGLSFHDEGTPERATTALLITIERVLLPFLHELGCEYWELAPIVLGAELRKRGRQCFVNYAEYQKYLHYTNSAQFATIFQRHTDQLLASSQLDHVTEFNKRTYTDISKAIEEEWSTKLQPRPRYKGRVKWYSAKKGYGFIISDQGEEFHVEQRDIEGTDKLEDNYPVTFEVFYRADKDLSSSAIRVRLESLERHKGRVSYFDSSKKYGFIITDAQKEKIYVHSSDVIGGKELHSKDVVSFEVVQEDRGPRAIKVKKEKPPRYQGVVQWFDSKKGFGRILLSDGRNIFVHKNDIENANSLKNKQKVSFEIEHTSKGDRAILVKIIKKG